MSEFEQRARDAIQAELENHDDPNVRAIAAITEPPPDVVSRVAAAMRAVANTGAKTMSELATLKAERDALNERIKLIEGGIRKGAAEACYSQQLITINEARIAQGKRQITQAEFSSGLLADAEKDNDQATR